MMVITVNKYNALIIFLDIFIVDWWVNVNSWGAGGSGLFNGRSNRRRGERPLHEVLMGGCSLLPLLNALSTTNGSAYRKCKAKKKNQAVAICHATTGLVFYIIICSLHIFFEAVNQFSALTCLVNKSKHFRLHLQSIVDRIEVIWTSWCYMVD